MTESLCLQIIPQRMKSLNIPHYQVRFRHLVLGPLEVRILEGAGDLFFQLTPLANLPLAPIPVRVDSQLGYVDLLSPSANELHYEHSGKIVITSLDAQNATHIQFIQVSPHYGQ